MSRDVQGLVVKSAVHVVARLVEAGQQAAALHHGEAERDLLGGQHGQPRVHQARIGLVQALVERGHVVVRHGPVAQVVVGVGFAQGAVVVAHGLGGVAQAGLHHAHVAQGQRRRQARARVPGNEPFGFLLPPQGRIEHAQLFVAAANIGDRAGPPVGQAEAGEEGLRLRVVVDGLPVLAQVEADVAQGVLAAGLALQIVRFSAYIQRNELVGKGLGQIAPLAQHGPYHALGAAPAFGKPHLPGQLPGLPGQAQGRVGPGGPVGVGQLQQQQHPAGVGRGLGQHLAQAIGAGRLGAHRDRQAGQEQPQRQQSHGDEGHRQ